MAAGAKCQLQRTFASRKVKPDILCLETEEIIPTIPSKADQIRTQSSVPRVSIGRIIPDGPV